MTPWISSCRIPRICSPRSTGCLSPSLSVYRATSSLFTFTADPALAAFLDPCITGSPQPGVAVGYWLLLPPLTPGKHTLHFGAPSLGQDITYILTVRPGRGR